MTLYPEQLMPETVENLHLPSGLELAPIGGQLFAHGNS
jgi:hypothetical protein